MAVGDTALPSQFYPDEYDDDVLLYGSALKPRVNSTQVQMNDNDDDFIAELTRHMAHFMLQDDDTFDDFSGIGSQVQNLEIEMSRDLTGPPGSNLWSPVGSNQGSPEGSPSPSTTTGKGQDSCSKTFKKMKLDKRDYEIQSSNSSNTGLCSYQSLIQEQIRAIELSRLKQEQKGQVQISEPKEKIQIQHFHKKGKLRGANERKTRPQRPIPQTQTEAGSGTRVIFHGGSGSRGGTGVFLPRGGTGTRESTNKQGKGCSTVLIPPRVAQALQLHFDKMAAISRPKVVGFPPLHDVLVSKRDDMYSLQKLQSRKVPENVQNEIALPQEWTY